MTDRRRTAVAGLVSGVIVIGTVNTVLPYSPVGVGTIAVFVSAATALMTWSDMRPLTLLVTWVAAAVVFAVRLAAADPQSWQGLHLWLVVLGLWCATFAVGPWLLAMGVLRHLMTPADDRPSFRLEDLHSEAPQYT